MNTAGIVAKIEDQLAATARVATADAAAEPIVDALVTALGPALREAALELAQQAATELGAQLSTGTVEVVLSDGEPSLMVRTDETQPTFNADELEARMTVRLPGNLKAALEEAADMAGDSVNSYVLKTLAVGTSRGRRTRRVRETLET